MDTARTPACLDAETMAAWMDGGLSGAALTAAETHASSCPRCQTLLAAMVRIEPAEQRPSAVPAAVPATSRLGDWRFWLAPVAAAAVILIAIALPRRSAETPAPPAAMTAAAPPEAQAPLSAPAVRQEAAPLAEKKESKLAKTEAAEGRGQQGQAGQRVPPKDANVPARALADEFRTTKPPVTPPEQTVTLAQPPVAAPPVAPPPPAVASPVGAVAATPPAGAAARSSTVSGLPQSSLNVTIDGVSASAVVAEFGPQDLIVQRSQADQAMGARGGGGGAGRGGVAGGTGGGGRATGLATSAPRPPAQEPDPLPNRWRVLASGAVERSTTGTPAWVPVSIEPPGLRVTNGVAPSPTVCWLVGRGGLVLLSTDGIFFTRLTFPETVDLVSITATNAREATVTTADGRTFVTRDAGQTWVMRR